MQNNQINKYIAIKKNRIQAMHPVKDYFKIKKETKKLQAIQEAGRDILNTTITSTESSTNQAVDKNNYKTYATQLDGIYNMYESASDYGGEICKGIVDTRVGFIVGEGVSVSCPKNPNTEKFIERFMNLNKLHGSRLLEFGQLSELEGKLLTVLSPDKANKTVKARSLPYYTNPYDVKYKSNDLDEIDKVVYKPKKKESETKSISGNSVVYIQTGGSGRYKQDATNRVHSVLTDIENFSRAKYDLRKNTHIFGRNMFNFQTDSMEAAASINNAIQSKEWSIGRSYAGMAKLSLLEPSGSASEAIIKDMLIGLKTISMTTGIPIHWLSWPELMSNRATAENLIQVIVSATKKERLLFEEGFKEMFLKAIDIAIDSGIAKNDIKVDPEDLNVTLPIISLELLKQVSEIWIPLWQSGIISKDTLMNKLPSINAYAEKKALEKEQGSSIDQKGILNELQNEDYDDSNED